MPKLNPSTAWINKIKIAVVGFQEQSNCLELDNGTKIQVQLHNFCIHRSFLREFSGFT
ncbi:hypothetical protein FDUTEX481_06105 [Tolypothrix sp. PCC 7601]|nr:hypothetical protein FDUTEX481_06105 [Tolypothrix sp. PCC 7601]